MIRNAIFWTVFWTVLIALGLLVSVAVVNLGGDARTVRGFTALAKLGIVLAIGVPAGWVALRRFRDRSADQKRRAYAWLGAIVGMALFAAGWNDSNDSLVLIGAVLLSIGLWADRVALTDRLTICLWNCFHYLRFHKDGIGTSLMIVGVGIVVMLMPDLLRYAIHSDGYLLDYESTRVALAAMMVTGGWHLRHLGRWDGRDGTLNPPLLSVIVLVAAACILLEAWTAWSYLFPPPRPLYPRRPI